MEWFIAVVVVAILGIAAVAAAGGMGEMSKEPVRDTYRQDLPSDRPLAADDIRTLRFGITLRGYAMSQVDDVLDRLGREIALRDAQIAELGGSGRRFAGAQPAAPGGFSERPVEPVETAPQREPE
jgi:DivIVA domain-containing protein